ncbi:MAG TPA: response regulator [Blastocatellia bacterium]|nr:response regulator [Blastocatellia bacterium]HMX25159.1 response regulator [Blastocatellia bacterium]HNG34214.1 response regulator [Blastocatellia bacterium]
MSELQFGLSPEHLAQAFPFHLVLNRALRIVQAGRVLQRIIGLELGTPFAQVFHINRPKVPLDFDSLSHEQHSFFLLQAHSSPLQLKGQILQDAAGDALFFLGSPWLTDFHQVEQLGIKINDFAPHDSLVHYLSLLQTKNTALNEANRLAEKLHAQSAELGRVNRELAVQHAVTSVLGNAKSLAEAAPSMLRVMGEGIGWQCGSFWLSDDEKPILRCIETWNSSTGQYEEFSHFSRRLSYERGQGLPGRVWSEGIPVWIHETVADESLPRLTIARKAGLHGAFGFPVKLGNEVKGVVEFFTQENAPPDERLMELATNIGDRLEQFIERKSAESAQQASETRKSAILESALDCIITMDHEGRIAEFNPAAERVFGYTRGEVIGQTMSDLIIPRQYRALHQAGLARYLDTGEHKVMGQRIEIVALRKDGTEFPVELAITPFQFNGQPMFTGYLRDITSARQAREELRLAKDAAESASLAKSRFLATMSHEIRTPLNAIIGMSELALETQSPTDRHEFLQIIQSSSEQLLYLINDILDFSKIEAGQLDIEAIAFDPCQVAESVLRMLAERAQRKGIALRCELDPQLPARLLGDANRLRQILLNLVSNAIKFTESGEVCLRTEVIVPTIQPTHGVELHFAVSDTGIGIAPENHERIFEKFSQADPSITRRYGGTGLGLSISKSLVELMQGRIWLESALGQGSTFHIALGFPLVQHTQPLSKPDELPAKTAASEFSTRPVVSHRILMIEDSPANQQLVLRILEKAGYQVDLAENGEIGVQRAQAARYDLILMDIQMPVMDGFAATKAIRQYEEKSCQEPVPIIALTAHAIEGYREQCLAQGMDDYLTKPIKRERLLESVRECLERRHVVLVVEDTIENQKLIKNYLKDEPLRLLFAHNGRQALDLLARRQVSLVLLDMEMPVMNGFETITQLRRRYDASALPVIALTAHDNAAVRARCLESGCTDFLTKPFKKSQLLDTVHRHLKSASGAGAFFSSVSQPTEGAALIAYVEEDILDLIPDFLAERQLDVQRIQDGLVAADYTLIQRLGHNMKGSGAAYGFEPLTLLGKAIEECAKQRRHDEITKLHGQLADYLRKVQVLPLRT